ncbi:MAG: dTDP-4-dehydrorhamnose 3,5-epimerase [Sphingobacteriales bacterium]|nr:MAG: dTDP-4-dehydrorhamnose 3,5-epimerase [Sphingobacteriales bacterium]
MQVEETKLKGCFIIIPAVFKDSRGNFFESFNKVKFEALTKANGDFVQDNQSSSTYGTVRGLHMQLGDSAQAKLVRVLSGEVLDVAVDLRPDSATYGASFSIRLSAENKLQLYIPRGFAHGFSVLSETAIFAYKCDNYYDKAAEAGIRYDDATLNIDWGVPAAARQLSAKDLALPFLKQNKQI